MDGLIFLDLAITRLMISALFPEIATNENFLRAEFPTLGSYLA